MSIHGDQPIPCWRQEECAEAWEGKNYCDPFLKQCTRACDASGSPVPVPNTDEPVFRYPAKTTASLQPIDADNVAKDSSWRQAADKMWNDLLNFGNMKVPGNKNPSIVEKLMFVFFGSPYRADISGVLIIAVAVILFLL